MDAKNIIVLAVMLLSLALPNLVVSNDVTVAQNGGPGNFSCTINVGDGSFTNVANCTNGKGLFGCCVERARCDYNTSNIDLTLYAQPGFKSSCAPTSVCCPINYILAASTKVDNSNGDDFNDDDI